MKSFTIPPEIEDIARQRGYIFDETQLHVGGEREILSPNKFVLTGRDADDRRIVVKCAREKEAILEIEQEHAMRNVVKKIHFAEEVLLVPKELYYDHIGDYTILVTEFIEQDQILADYPIRDQFFMVLQTLEAQESFHATTHEHDKLLRDTFTTYTADRYLEDFKTFIENSKAVSDFPHLTILLERGYQVLFENRLNIERHTGYLIHTDLVPHNIRIHDRTIYLLDFVSFKYGNKYESWARIANYLVKEDPELETLIEKHVLKERGESEYHVFKLMRMYKVGFLLNFYIRALTKTEGDLHELTRVRIQFWTSVLESLLESRPIIEDIRNTYLGSRNALRTEEEKARQREFSRA